MGTAMPRGLDTAVDRSTCPECGDDNWATLGCISCGLQFFPPSEAYWAGISLSRRIELLWADWLPDPGQLPLRESASPIEKKFWDAHLRLRLPELDGLVFQHRAGKFSIDFALPDERIGFELDGFRDHSTTADITRDHVRQRWLACLGWSIHRWGGSEVTHGAEGCVRQAAFLARVIREGISQ